jgi:RNA polymerase sigma-70 factor (ECF subfamily)
MSDPSTHQAEVASRELDEAERDDHDAERDDAERDNAKRDEAERDEAERDEAEFDDHDAERDEAELQAVVQRRIPVEELNEDTLRKVVAGNKLALHAFVKRYERLVFGYLSRKLGHGPHVEELAQQTFIRAHRALPRFEIGGRAKVSTWLFTIAGNLAKDWARTPTQRLIRDRRLAAFDGESSPAQGPTPEEETHLRELAASIDAAVAKLPPDQREAFVLETEGLSLAEIATTHAVSTSTVKTRLFRARARLRKLLAFWRKE